MHKLLERQLKRLDLNDAQCPASQEKWAELLQRINNTYHEVDKERYLLQRSMEISSSELLDLNRMLEHAQHIAQMGHWVISPNSTEIFMSTELRKLLGVQPGETNPTTKDLISKIHDEDRSSVREKMHCVVNEGIGFECEFRYLHPDGTYHWLFMVGQPFKELGGAITKFTGVTMDITPRKLAESEVLSLHQQLLVAARQAGMADISTSILHNVGNVLNSVSVSLEVLKESLAKSKYSKFKDVSDLIANNIENIGDYISKDAKGKLIPQYLNALTENAIKEFSVCGLEISNLETYIEHIKEIVASQNSFSKNKGFLEEVPVIDLVESAIKMSGVSTEKEGGIKFKRCFGMNKPVAIDKSKVLQILVNLFQNAVESVSANDNSQEKEVQISVVEFESEGEFRISVKDNGLGIDPENITKIFSFGFSTKVAGHGFGLHASALAAKEMGGKLIAESKGVGMGATFVLTLPAA